MRIMQVLQRIKSVVDLNCYGEFDTMMARSNNDCAFMSKGDFMGERLNLSVADGVGAKLATLAGGERKIGAWLSDLAIALYDQAQPLTAPIEAEAQRLTLLGLVATVRALEARTMRLEQQLGAVIAGGK